MPSGKMHVRARAGTNTAVDITAEGRAADLVAASLGSVPQPPPDWNDDTKRAALTGSGATGGSYLRVIIGENQTKGLGILAAAWASLGLSEAWSSAQKATTNADKATAIAAGKEGTTRALSDNATKVSLAEIAAGHAVKK